MRGHPGDHRSWVFGYSLYRPLTHTEIAVILSLAVVSSINLFGQHFDAILQRNLEFKKISLISFSMNLANPVVAVTLAAAGWGVWSLVFGQLAGALVFLFGSWRLAGWTISIAYSKDTARWFMSIGSRYLGSRSLEVLYTELDRLVIKRVMGSYEQVGLYDRANLASRYPTRIVNPVVNNVAFPVYSKLKLNRAQLSEAYGLVTFFLIRALLPFGLVFLLAPDAFITALLGERWIAAGKVLRVLAVYAVAYPIVENLKVLFYALGRPEVVSKARIAQIVVFVPLLFLLVNLMGIVGAAYAILISILVTYAVFLFLLRGEVEFSLIRTVGLPMAFAGLTYLVYSVLPQPLFGNRIVELLFSSCIIFSIFGACEMLFERQIIFKHIRYIRTTLGSPTSDELEATRDRER
ncbi:MAG: oligosaccharide flippase family protein [Ignavibacteria bacterium]|nr:oligosaccharide flippase family protein [Ignavibacteria bacterium]